MGGYFFSVESGTVKSLIALIIAEACNPEWVSVPLVAWSHYEAIARRTRAHLVTQIRNRDALLRAGLVEGRDFTAIDSEAIARRAYAIGTKLRGEKGKGWTVLTAINALSFPYFEKLLWEKLGSRIRTRQFDVVHQLSPLSPTVPSRIATHCRRAGVPFVWGPLNGGVPWPKEFDRARRDENEWLSYVRDAHRLMPGYLATRRDSSAILIGSRDTFAQMPRSFHGKCFYLPENAIDPARFGLARTRQASRPLRAVFLGRLVPYKGADMLLEASAPLVRDGDLIVDIIGDGPQMPLLREIVAREGIASGVRLDGWVEHQHVQSRLVESDVLTFPSIREFGGGVVLEAMAVGVVPIIADYGGPAELVTPATGFKLPMGRRDQLIKSLQSTLRALVANHGQVDAMSVSARARAHTQFTWDAKAGQTVQVYDWVTGRIPQRPVFPVPVPDVGAEQPNLQRLAPR